MDANGTRANAGSRYETAARALAAIAALALVAALGWLLPRSGYSQSRLLLFALVGGTAIAAAAGVWTGRPGVAAAGTVGLVLLGFWQAVLGVFVFPAVGLLALAFLLEELARRRRASA